MNCVDIKNSLWNYIH